MRGEDDKDEMDERKERELKLEERGGRRGEE